MGLIANLKRAFAVRTPRSLEITYLEEATSPSDLELRHREIDRGRFRRGR
jgi:hypothetical protein